MNDIGKKHTGIDYLKYLPVIAPLLVFFGVARLSFYYSQFHINIIYFLDFSEIITEFFDFLVINVFTITISSFVFGLIFLIMKIKNAKVLMTMFQLIMLGIIFFSATYGRYNNNVSYVTISLFYACLLYVAVFNPKITRPHHNAFLEELYSKTIRFGTVGIILLSIWLIAKSDAYDVKILKKYSGVKVSYRDGIITNSNNYYIGSTTNYVFVYNEKSNTTAVYKLADIESIVFAGLNK